MSESILSALRRKDLGGKLKKDSLLQLNRCEFANLLQPRTLCEICMELDASRTLCQQGHKSRRQLKIQQ